MLGRFFFFFFGFVSIFACGLCFSQQTLPCIFFRWFALRFREITYAKNSVCLAASFGHLLLNEKQKKPFVSLNNEVSEASYQPLAVRANKSNVLV